MTEPHWSSHIARDFTRLQYAVLKKSASSAKEAIIIIHGITAEFHHHEAFADECLRESDIYFPVLRGYDQSPKRGDIDYIGQYDDDLFDFIHFIEKKGYEKVTLAGHSMGCANLLRLIQKNKSAASEYLFIAPFFHPTLPVYREEATEKSSDRTDVDYTVFDKKVMLLMTLYKMNFHQFNDRTVAEIPDEFNKSEKLTLSFRLLASRFLEKIPPELLKDIKDKVSIYVGSEDEVLLHDEFQRYVKDHWNVDVTIIQGTDHNHILHHPQLHKEWAGQ
ncbi:alpha/beta fold hydrolase [Halobacillus litoralis]|uniref:Alpha/beta fold hydrolase n=1 Tax=Halobacillus litoralis TaxID=45668 RepID=A0A845DYR0_9BACI|nr:alpha/beta hydrolase [Halobacillus litoralis]MYL48547.1 alpha/beta fold hydrolase [Halobacillus litoralis]